MLALAVGVPTASAPGKIDGKQNRAIKQQSKNIKKNRNAIRKNTKGLRGIRKAARGTADAIAALKIVAERGDKNAAAILAQAPAILDGLTQLKAGLEAAGAGLLALKSGLEEAGAGLVSLKTLATSTEYGFGQVVVLSAGPTQNPQLGSFVVTPDIPDAVQQAQTTQQFVAQHTGNLVVAYGVRSFETDGDGTVPAAVCRVTVTNKAGATESTAGNVDLGGLPFQPVLTKSPPTSTDPLNVGFPFGLKTEGADADVTQNLVTSVPVTAGDTYTVGMSCVDTSPDAADPSA